MSKSKQDKPNGNPGRRSRNASKKPNSKQQIDAPVASVDAIAAPVDPVTASADDILALAKILSASAETLKR